MKEIVIRQFFEGHATAVELAADAIGAFDRHTDGAGVVFSRLHALPMSVDFPVTSEHLVKLVDAVTQGIVDLEALDAICFCLEASDYFIWDTDTSDGERVAEALFLLGTPEVNYPLSPTVLDKIRYYLVTGEKAFTEADLRPAGDRPQLMSVKQIVARRDV